MNNVFLIEDHDQALKVWRKNKVRGLDLVHIDAHIDFNPHKAEPIQRILSQAQSLKELKSRLEYSLAFRHYQKDLSKQTDIGNYIYPAIEEGIIRDFYWVIPGGLKEFKASAKCIENILKGLFGDKKQSFQDKSSKTKLRSKESKAEENQGIVSSEFLGRKLIICILDRLPVLKQRVLLDIDTDFLVVDSLLSADNTKNIGKRKPWIPSAALVGTLKEKVKRPEIITIAYSVNGGFTPIIYKHLGDQLAYHYAPERFKGQLKKRFKAADYFHLFHSTNKKEYYRKAISLNPRYRVQDNNYGPLFLALGKFSLAEKEFLKIISADPGNTACLFGLGNIALRRKEFRKARNYFSSALVSQNLRLFLQGKRQSLFGLARAEFGLKNFKRAKELLLRYKRKETLQPYSYYLLGRIFEKEKDFDKAALFYKDAIRLGLTSIWPIWRLAKISVYPQKKDDIIKCLNGIYKEFKKNFLRTKRLNAKKKLKGLRIVEKKMRAVEKMLGLIR
jgi:tetratricopeptide (TPR) repeat protein